MSKRATPTRHDAAEPLNSRDFALLDYLIEKAIDVCVSETQSARLAERTTKTVDSLV